MRVFACDNPKVEEEFPLSYSDIVRAEGVYQPSGFGDIFLIVVGDTVLYHCGRVLQSADGSWKDVKFRRVAKHVCFELRDTPASGAVGCGGAS